MERQEKMLPGKLDHDTLNRLLQKYTDAGDRIVIGSRVGEDATVIDMGDQLLVLKTDPITFITDQIGYYLVHINANDVYCLGATPRWLLVTLLLPAEKTDHTLVETIFSQISKTCKKEKISFCGGHTEITLGLDRVMAVGQMVGVVKRKQLIDKRKIWIDDHVILVGSVPLEGTSIIAREKSGELESLYSADFVEHCQNLLFKPGISVKRYAKIAMQVGGVHGMHDPTEGGIASALHELSVACDLGIEIHEEKITTLTEGKLLCDHYELDPLGTIASGSLLLVTPSSRVRDFISAYADEDIPAEDIGVITSLEKGRRLIRKNETVELPFFHRDEIIKIF
jgi:hydrogenase expression/formation protein HypE